jgi:mRNA interferase RelE/StbE
MTWAVEFTSKARKDLARLPVRDQRRIADFLRLRASARENPRALAKRLAAVREELWRFRVGDYRVIVQFQDKGMVILVVEIGNRREICR